VRTLKSILIIGTLLTLSQLVHAKTIQIEFTKDDSFSIEVAHINLEDSVEWLPVNEGHNVEFLGGPEMDSLPPKSDIDEVHVVNFKVPGVYLYQCTPHGNMGMIGLIVVNNDLHNIENIKDIKLSRIGKSVLNRLIRIANSSPK